jgi:hypothetical protein
MPHAAGSDIRHIMDDHPYRQTRRHTDQPVPCVSIPARWQSHWDLSLKVCSAPGSGFLHRKKDYAMLRFDLDAGMSLWCLLNGNVCDYQLTENDVPRSVATIPIMEYQAGIRLVDSRLQRYSGWGMLRLRTDWPTTTNDSISPYYSP